MSQHSLTLPGGETIQYQLERRSRRTIGLKITADGLVVHAPNRIFVFQLQQVLQQKADWIINKLEARRKNAMPELSWQSGERLHYLGNAITLEILQGKPNKPADIYNNKLLVTVADTANAAHVQRKVVQWYKKQALVDFARRLEIHAAKLGVSTPPLYLSSAQSRWGSCSSGGDVRLNWRLLQAPPEIINYVVCHELAHLKEMNHSAKFWAVVASIFPDYKRAEKTLKTISAQLHRL